MRTDKVEISRHHIFCALYVLPPFSADKTLEEQMKGIPLVDEITETRITPDLAIGQFANYFWLMRFDLQLREGSVGVGALTPDRSPLNYDRIHYDAILTMTNDPSEYLLLEKKRKDEFEEMMGNEYFWVKYGRPIGRLRPPDAPEGREVFFGIANLLKLSAPLLLSKLVEDDLRSSSVA